jgi:thiol-disulfide isomerase/thioredoxin
MHARHVAPLFVALQLALFVYPTLSDAETSENDAGKQAADDHTGGYYYYYFYYGYYDTWGPESKYRDTDGVIEITSAHEFTEFLQMSLPQGRDRRGLAQESRGASAAADLVILFYAPWCGYCKKLLPQYSKLASQLDTGPQGSISSDHQEHHVLVAKLDATATSKYIYL